MKDLKKVIKRDYKLYLAELLVCIVMAILIYAGGADLEVFGDANYHIGLGNIVAFMEVFYMIVLEGFVPVMMICTFICWAIFDDKGQKLFKASLPISNSQESKYDMISGCFSLFVASIIVIVFGIVDYFMWQNVFGASYAKSMWVLLIIDVIKFFVIGCCANAVMVIGKRVSSSVLGGTMGFIIVIGGFVTCFEQFIEYNIIDGLFGHHIDLNSIPYNIALLVGYLFILALLLIALVVANKKVDIAKGGTYYFKSVQIAICVLVTVYIIYAAEIKKVMELSVFYGICVIALAFMCGGGIYYLTRARK